MNIDLSRFKVAYKFKETYREAVFNAVALLDLKRKDENGSVSGISFIDVLVLTDDGNLHIISDKAWKFRFIPIAAGA